MSAVRTRKNVLSMRSVMTPVPMCLRTDESLADAEAKMHDAKQLPVLHEGKLVGVLSRRDLYFLRRVAPADTPLSEITRTMVPDVHTADADDGAAAVVARMAEQRYASIVVLDRGAVVGIFTADDAVALLAELLA